MLSPTWITCGTVGVIVLVLIANVAAPDAVFLAGLAALLALGVFGRHPEAAFAGFASAGTVTVAALFVVAAGLEETGALDFVSRRVLGRPRSERAAYLRLLPLVTAISAFLNNTLVVAMLMPIVNDWARRIGISRSRLLMPLAFAASFGGVCTLIGTSTNLVVYGMLRDFAPERHLGFFDVGWVGVPCAVLSVGFVVLGARRLLPERRSFEEQLQDPRQYAVEMVVMDNSPIVGMTIEDAGLRGLTGLFLAEIDREGDVIAAVRPEERLRAGDRLVFVGIVESIAELRKVKGLVPAPEHVFKLTAPRSERCLVEAVVSETSPLLGSTVREIGFRTLYSAAILAVLRGGERLRRKIGDVVLQPGDTLLLEAHPRFAAQHRNSRDFYLVRQVQNSAPLRHERAPYALGVLALLVAALALEWMDPAAAALIAAALMVMLRCLPIESARRAIDLPTLLVIGAAFGIGRALEFTGAAAALAGYMIDGLDSRNPVLMLAVIYGITAVFTAFMSNNAAAALLFPLAMQVAQSLGVSVIPFAVTVMIGASASFATPIGYQTNLMVYGPGGYRFTDYTRLGLPLNFLWGVITVLLAPIVFPFAG